MEIRQVEGKLEEIKKGFQKTIELGRKLHAAGEKDAQGCYDSLITHLTMQLSAIKRVEEAFGLLELKEQGDRLQAEIASVRLQIETDKRQANQLIHAKEGKIADSTVVAGIPRGVLDRGE